MDWKHTYINTVLEPGETYYLLYDFKSGHSIFMGKNCRLQNELLAHPIPMIDAEYPGKYENKVPAQEMIQILEARYKEAEGNLRKQIENRHLFPDVIRSMRLNTFSALMLRISCKEHIE